MLSSICCFSQGQFQQCEAGQTVTGTTVPPCKSGLACDALSCATRAAQLPPASACPNRPGSSAPSATAGRQCCPPARLPSWHDLRTHIATHIATLVCFTCVCLEAAEAALIVLLGFRDGAHRLGMQQSCKAASARAHHTGIVQLRLSDTFAF